MGLSEKHLQAKNADKATLYSPIGARATPAPTSKLPEERECVIDSGASMHMLSKKVLSSEEMDTTLRRSRTPAVVVTANGEVQTNEDAHVYVRDLGLVTVKLLVDAPAVLLFGKLCEER